MTSTDFMEEKEVFELLGKKKQLSGGYAKTMGFRCQYLPIQHGIAAKLLYVGLKKAGSTVMKLSNSIR